MNAPRVEGQIKISGQQRRTFGVVKELEMSMKKGINQSVAWAIEGFSKIRPWAIARGLILGVLLAGGTMLYFGMTSESTSEAVNSLPKELAADFRFTDLDVSADGLSVYAGGLGG